ncbi:translocation and assembly module lipoprotein TamL [Parafilimonas sp.]|uniref:translocation and assembly module lipoprotein TamL n=1 Tax=Parafilimonas sp. TaxID=1969739 RepID=UPI003F7D75A7
MNLKKIHSIHFKHLAVFAGLVLLLASCSNTKNLGPGQNLFVGSKEKIKSTDKIPSKKRKELESEMSSLVRPEPNSTILGARFKLTVFNMFKEPKKPKGLIYWLKYKVGEPPVLASNSALEKNRLVLQSHLENEGFFRDSVVMDTSVKNKKLSVTYTALVDTQYIINNVSYPNDSSVLAKNIQRYAVGKKYVLLKPNNPYSLDVIKDERTRIDARLKDKGFYYFNPDYLLAKADSTIGNHKVDIDLRIKPETPSNARLPYYINNVYVFADYDINSDTTRRKAKLFEGYRIVDPNHKYNPKIFSRTLVFKPGELYNRTDHNLSLNRLITLGIYKFVKVRFEPARDSVQKLNAFYYLTPTNVKSIRFEVSGLTKSNNATGGEFSTNWRHRNLFKGAELFTIAANFGFQTQISSGYNVNTLSYGLEANLFVPRIIAPFRLNTSSAYVPQTKFGASYKFYNRTTQYTLRSIGGTYGYVWKDNIKNEHEFTLININAVKPANFTDSFKALIDTNLTVRRSVEKQFIIGSIYNYNYNSQAQANTKKNNFYFNGNVDASGNLLGLITGANVLKGEKKKILGQEFTQYIKLEGDFRHYLKLGKYNSFNTRFDAGIAAAYGNDTLVPFIKEFFAGGVSDLRGFRARTLVGGYYAGNPREKLVWDQPGDVKLLLSAEYRAKLFSILRYALFADAGNVWTLKYDSERPGSKFSSKDFMSQIAVDAGIGLRADVSILILRLDVAFPLHLPYNLPNGEKYKIDFGDSEWRKNNIVWNLAIGYPF